MDDMIRMMAEAPEEEQNQMMTDRLLMFAAMPEDQRVNSMSQLITGFSKLPPDQREKLIAGQTRILAKLPEAKRKAVLVGRMKAGVKVGPEIHDSDMRLTNNAAMRLPDDKRAAFLASMEEVQAEMGSAMESVAAPAARGVPEHHGKPMELKGLLGKKYVCSICGHKQAA